MASEIRVILAALIVASVNLVNGQVSSSCTTSMISSFTPCANIITGSTNNNGLMPPSTCCDSLRSLMSTSMDCACLLVSANAPFFPLPITQALALSFSRACNINGLPLQCKASASPLPAPGPAVLGSNDPTPPSVATSPLSPQDSKMVEEEKYEKVQLLASGVEAEAPSRSGIPQIRPVLTPRPSPSGSSFLSPSSPPFAFLMGILLLGLC